MFADVYNVNWQLHNNYF